MFRSSRRSRSLDCRWFLPCVLPTGTGLSVVRVLLFSFTLIAIGVSAPFVDAQKVELSVDVTKTGAKIDRNIFGQFAEHLGHGFMTVSGSARLHNSQYSRDSQRCRCRFESDSMCRTYAGRADVSPTNITGATGSGRSES